MNTPLVSVIVPNYNHAPFLVQRLDSIINQSFRDFEVIILDDCSTDNSREIIEKYRSLPNVTIVFNEMNSGSPFAQWKKGISMARGNYIWIAESDDYADAAFLLHATDALDKGHDLFYCRSVRVDENGQESGDMNSWYTDLSPTRWLNDYQSQASEELSGALYRKNTIVNASAVVFRKRAGLSDWLNEISGMKYCGDWLFWMKYLSVSRSVCYTVQCRNYFRIHPGVSRRVHARDDRNREIMIVLDYILHRETTPELRRRMVHYFFIHHLYKDARSNVFANLGAMMTHLGVSRHFVREWLRYYFA